MPWSDDDLDDREFPDEDDDDDEAIEADSSTQECPRCGADVYEDIEQCPLCGTWITRDTSPWSGRSMWWVVLGLIGILALLWTLSLGVL